MRIATDIRPLLEKNRAGVSLYTLNLLCEAVKHTENEYALFCNSSKLPFPEDAPSGANVEQFDTNYPNRMLNALFALCHWPKVETLVNRADIVYLPNLNFIATDKPLVLTVHDLSFFRYPEFFTCKQKLWHRLINVERMIGRATSIVAVSEHTKTDIIETFGVPEEKVRAVTPGISKEYYCRPPHEKAQIRKKYGLSENFILYLGTLEPRKNVNGLIRAYDMLEQDIDLVIAGTPGWLYKDIFDAAKKSPKNERIKFIGYVKEEDKPALYSSARIFAYPSHYEGFGMPVLEAMACGTPIVTSNNSSLGEVVGNAGLLCNPEKNEEIVMALDAILESPGFEDRLRKNGLSRAENFSWSDSADRLRETFSSCLK